MDYMGHALELSRRAIGTTSPNPPVGVVVVKNGDVVGEGYTQPQGSDHAEVVALRHAGSSARGAILYTTLEPCAHYGHTPPCTLAIITAGIAAVRIAMLDPNPLVNGAGKAELEKAGISVHVGEGAQVAKKVNESYAKHIVTGLPFVAAKFAASLDGKIAASSGDSKWITGPESRRYANLLRAQYDAVMVGINTIVQDDPELTLRGEDDVVAPCQPLRVVIDSHGRTPPTARLFQVGGPILIVVAEIDESNRVAIERAGAEIIELPSSDRTRVDVRAALEFLGLRGVTGVLVEGGGTLLGSLFDERLINKVLAILAPVVIGGATSPSAVSGQGALHLRDALRLSEVTTDRIGEDIVVIGYPRQTSR